MNKAFFLAFTIAFLASCGGSSSDNNNTALNTPESLLAGTWSRCNNFGDNSAVHTAVQGNGVWEDTFTFYTGLNCETLDETATPFVETGTYEIGEQIILENDITTYEITWFSDNQDFEACYSIFGVEGDILFFADYTSEDCQSPETRHTQLDYENPLVNPLRSPINIDQAELERLFAGTWSRCESFSSTSQLFTVIQGNGDWEKTVTEYSDQNCVTINNLEDPEIETRTYELGDRIRLRNGDLAFEITWFFDNPDESPCYSIFGLDGDILFFEYEFSDDCQTPETRHSLLHRSRPYTRQ